VNVADIAYLRKHYASLSDEALLEVDRGELTEVAQQCYADELKERHLTAPVDPDEDDDPTLHYDGEGFEGEADEDSDDACACTFGVAPDGTPSTRALDAKVILQHAGIPCRLALHKLEVEDGEEAPSESWLMVASPLVMAARSVLDKEMFNDEVEEGWRSYFENLSDEELREADTKQLFGGLLDRLERATQAYDDEKKRRGV
jgi:hypothetical protein